MAGSSRGRGRSAFTFNIEAIGFAKGSALPDVICQPPPPFPVSTACIFEPVFCVQVKRHSHV